MKLKFAIKNALLFLVFIIIGTLTHESGHYLVARLFGYKAHISFASTHEFGVKGSSILTASYESLTIWIIAGGILMTILIGTVGLLLCLKNRHYEKLNWKIHLYILLALFWGRELYCLIFTVIHPFLGGKTALVGDEPRLSGLLNLPDSFFSILLGSIALLVCTYVFFYIKGAYRITFLISAIIGAAAGAFLWFGLIGPIVMPQ